MGRRREAEKEGKDSFQRGWAAGGGKGGKNRFQPDVATSGKDP